MGGRPFYRQNRSLIGFSFKNRTPRYSCMTMAEPPATRPTKTCGLPRMLCVHVKPAMVSGREKVFGSFDSFEGNLTGFMSS